MNEAAGHGGVALAAGLSGLLATELAARDVLVVAGAAIAAAVFLRRPRHRRARHLGAGSPPP